MKFATLEVWELVTENDCARTHVFENVDVVYPLDGRSEAVARIAGVQVARLGTYDDDPASIDSERIAGEQGRGAVVITGVAIEPVPTGKTEYAFWRLVLEVGAVGGWPAHPEVDQV